MFAPRTAQHRKALTLIELLVVIAIIIFIAALAAAFMPRVQDSTRLNNAVDQLSQWLLTAKMQAKRDGQVTGIQLQDPNATGFYTQAVYVQQPDPIVGGSMTATGFTGPYVAAASGTTVTFGNADFSLGGLPNPLEWLVLPNDYLELRDGGGVHLIQAVAPNAVTVLSGLQPVVVAAQTANFRILRQPRPLIGENTLQFPGNLAVNPTPPAPTTQPAPPLNVLFSPSGAVVGPLAGQGRIFLFVGDMTMNPADPNFYARSGVVGVQTLTGFIGTYQAAEPPSPWYLYAIQGRGSGM
jgi:type II secretory pathway pseudopilin PulG